MPKNLPNGIRIFNGTPHVIRFWHETWDEPVEVPPDRVISAQIRERQVEAPYMFEECALEWVQPTYMATEEGAAIVDSVPRNIVIVGSIIAAQAYPVRVAAMVPCVGYERVPPQQKRMRPDKFTIFRG
jgi:hypothetical protein